MSCIRIRLKDIPNIHTEMLDDLGYCVLDLNPTTELSLSKQLSQLSDANELAFDYIIDVDLPNTPKNFFVLKKFFHGKNDRIEVNVFTGSVWMGGVYLSVGESTADAISASFIFTELYWGKRLSETYMKDMVLFPMLETDALLPHSDGGIPWAYVDGLRPYYYPVVDYGDLRYVTGEDHKDITYLNYKQEKIGKCKGGDTITSNTITSGDSRYRVFMEGSTLIVVFLNGFYDGVVVINGTKTLRFYGGVIKISMLEYASPITVTFTGYYVRKIVLFYDSVPFNGSLTITKGPVRTETVMPRSVNMDDLRPWFFALPLIRKMFCDLKFEFKSPILESNYGRRIITYILDRDLHEDNKTYVIPKPLNKGQPEINKFTIFEFGEKGVFDIKINVVGLLASKDEETLLGEQVEGSIAGIYAWVFEGETPVSYVGSYIEYEGTVGIFAEAIDVKDVVIKAGQSLRVWSAGQKAQLFIFDEIENEGEVDFSCLRNPFVRKTELVATRKSKFFWSDYGYNADGTKIGFINAASIIQRDLTQLQYLKAVAHLLNLKFYTNLASRQVYALQPFEVDLYGEVLEGFFETSLEELEVLPGTYKVDSQENNVKWHSLKFNGTDLFSHKIDVNPGLSSGEEITSENTLFKAVYLQEYGRDANAVGAGKLYRSNTTDKYYFPATEDVKEVEKTETYRPEYGVTSNGVIQGEHPKMIAPEFSQSPMVLLSYGRRQQFVSHGLFTKVHGPLVESSRTWATAIHYHVGLSKVEGFTLALAQSDFEIPAKTLLFKFRQDGTRDWLRRHSKGLSELLHYKWVVSQYRGLKVQYFKNIVSKDFFSTTLRKLYKLTHLGKPYTVYIQAIEDFKTCTTVSTIYDLKELPYVAPICEIYNENDIETEWRGRKDECEEENIPQVAVEYEIVGDIIMLTLSGLNTSPIGSVLFEYSVDRITWLVAENTSVITAEIPNASSYEIIYVRATVEYEDDCQTTITTPITFEACPYLLTDRFTARMYQKPDGSVCVIATITIPEEIEYEIILFTIDRGTGPVQYVNNTEICNITDDVVFNLTTKVNDCPEVDQEITLPYDDNEECPTMEDVGLECAPGIVFVKTGVLPVGVVISDTIYYQTSTDGKNWGTEWYVWYGDPITAPYVRARRVIELCDCPDICTPIIYCENSCPKVFTGDCVDCTLLIEGDDLTGCTIAWTGPESFTATGNNVAVTVQGEYTATITCGACEYIVPVFFDKGEAGTPTGDPIIVQD